MKTIRNISNEPKHIEHDVLSSDNPEKHELKE